MALVFGIQYLVLDKSRFWLLDPRISTIFNMGFKLEQNNGQIVLLFNCNGYCYFSIAMVTVTALFRAALWWQIKADGVEKIGWGQLRGTHRNVDLYLWTTQTYLSIFICLRQRLIFRMWVIRMGRWERGEGVPVVDAWLIVTSLQRLPVLMILPPDMQFKYNLGGEGLVSTIKLFPPSFPRTL